MVQFKMWSDVYTCDDLPCVNVGIGIMHHPMCGVKVEDCYSPAGLEEEETFPVDKEYNG